MTLLWAIPVVAAAVATLVVVARARLLEEESVGLAHEVRRLHDIRAPLGAIRATTVETDELVAAFRRRHQVEGDGPSRDGEGAGRGTA